MLFQAVGWPVLSAGSLLQILQEFGQTWCRYKGSQPPRWVPGLVLRKQALCKGYADIFFLFLTLLSFHLFKVTCHQSSLPTWFWLSSTCFWRSHPKNLWGAQHRYTVAVRPILNEHPMLWETLRNIVFTLIFQNVFLIEINRNLKASPFCLSSQSPHLRKPREREGNVSFSEILVPPLLWILKRRILFFQICSPFPDSHLTFSSSLFLMTIFFLPHCFSFFSSSPSSAPLVSPSGSVLLIGLLPSAATLISPTYTFPIFVSPRLSTRSFPVLFPPRFSKPNTARASFPFLPPINWAFHEFSLLVVALQLSNLLLNETGTAPDKCTTKNQPASARKLS